MVFEAEEPGQKEKESMPDSIGLCPASISLSTMPWESVSRRAGIPESRLLRGEGSAVLPAEAATFGGVGATVQAYTTAA